MNRLKNLVVNRQRSQRKAVFLLLIFEFLSLSLALIYNIESIKTTDFITYLALLVSTIVSTLILRKISKSDIILLMIVNMLFSIGVAIIYRLDPALGKRQLQYYLFGLLMFFVTYLILRSNQSWHKLAKVYFGISVFLFIVTLVFGSYLGGAKNWIFIGNISIQPSEFIKVPLAFYIASFYTHYNEYSKKPFGKYYMNLVVYIFIGFLFLQKDLGTALIFFGTMILSQFVYDKDRKLIILNMLAMIIGSIVAYFLFSHVRIRVATWKDPWSDIDATGYQITQALFAMASGGLFGSGIGLGRPDYIPVAESDFIFSAICEEMGIFMGIAVVLLFMILVYRAIKISLIQKDKFYSILAFVIGVLFALQTFIILGGVLKLIPLTGVTLPFISQGGSSMIAGFILLGCLQYCGEEVKYGDKINEE